MLDDMEIFLTTAELAERWRLDPGTLTNLRARGEGLAFVKLPSGAIRYKASDVLNAELKGSRGLTWPKLRHALDTYPGLDHKTRERLFSHIQQAFSGD